MGERVFVGLGSNLSDPEAQLRWAIDALAVDRRIQDLRASDFFRSEPWGDEDQPEFLNAVCECRCLLEPQAMLLRLQELERQAGRRRTARRWGPRQLDLDLLAWGQRRIERPELTIPHPLLAQRAFVLVPWAQLAPDFCVPGRGRVADLLAACPDVCTVKAFNP